MAAGVSANNRIREHLSDRPSPIFVYPQVCCSIHHEPRITSSFAQSCNGKRFFAALLYLDLPRGKHVIDYRPGTDTLNIALCCVLQETYKCKASGFIRERVLCWE